MGIWYPFGIALFQAGNSQFLYIAKAQQKFASDGTKNGGVKGFEEKRRERKAVTGVWGRLKRMEYSHKMFLFVTLGMAVQVSAR